MYTIVSIIVLIFLSFALFYKIKVITYTIDSQKIDKDLNLLFISDLHSCNYGNRQQKIIKEIKNLDFDCVLLGGDIIDDKLNSRYAFELIEELNKFKKPIYYVHGNHEKKISNLKKIDEKIKKLGVNLLESEELNLTSNVKLIGMDDSCKEILDNYENSLKKIDDELSSDKFNIMLIHKPDYYFKFNLQNVDLMISGHTHGGQWRIPFILNGLIAPGQGFLPKYAGGMYDEDYTLIVSRGLSKEKTIIPRLFNRPEINLIKLKPTVKSF